MILGQVEWIMKSSKQQQELKLFCFSKLYLTLRLYQVKSVLQEFESQFVTRVCM